MTDPTVRHFRPVTITRRAPRVRVLTYDHFRTESSSTCPASTTGLTLRHPVGRTKVIADRQSVNDRENSGRLRTTCRETAAALVVILVEVVCCVACFWVIFGRGVNYAVERYHSTGWFTFAYIVFYGATVGFIAACFLTQLMRGRPMQLVVLMYAIESGLWVAAIAVAVMEFIT